MTTSSLQSTTAMDIIVGALRNLNVLESGETPSANDATDALEVLNDLLESWFTEKLLVFASDENLLSFIPGQYQYTIGNPVVGQIAVITTANSNIINGFTTPSNVVVGSVVSDSGPGGFGAIPAGTTVTVVGPTALQLSNNATISAAADLMTYTAPGNFAIPRPVRITNAFTRITSNAGNPLVTGLDYQIRIINRDKYTALGLKGIAGPWPTDVYYDPTFPLGNLYFYPNPSQAGTLHLWTDTALSDFTTLTAAINLPQGYTRALKTNLAIELAAEFGKQVQPSLAMRAKESKALIKSLNASPGVEAFFDQHILKSRRADAGWIMHGGFYT